MGILLLQIKVMLQKKEAAFCYFFMLTMILIHFFQNIFKFAGTDISRMYQPLKLRMLYEDNVFGYYVIELLPVLVVLVSGFSYLDDRKSGEDIFWIARIGGKKYFFFKYAASFVTSLIVFGGSLLMETFLYLLSFPLSSVGDPSNITRFDEVYWELISRYFFPDIYINHPYLYGVGCCVAFGLMCGVLSSFSLAISMSGIFRFRILLFLPVYLILTMTYYFKDFLKLDFDTYYGYYFYFYDTAPKNIFALILFLMVLFVISLCLVCKKINKDVFEK